MNMICQYMSSLCVYLNVLVWKSLLLLWKKDWRIAAESCMFCGENKKNSSKQKQQHKTKQDQVIIPTVYKHNIAQLCFPQLFFVFRCSSYRSNAASPVKTVPRRGEAAGHLAASWTPSVSFWKRKKLMKVWMTNWPKFGWKFDDFFW